MSVQRVTLKDLADELGLSVAAVSMALRGHHRIGHATRERVRKLARRRGYRPDPALSALAAYRSQTAGRDRAWSEIGLVHDWRTEHWHAGADVYRRLHAALHREAEARGIRLVEAWLGARGNHADRVFRQLRNRGIRGLLIAPPADDPEPHPIEPPEGHFLSVTFGPRHIYPDHHAIQFDYYENLRLAWRKLKEQGCRRIGLVCLRQHGWRVGDAWLAAYLMEQHRAGISHASMPVCEMNDSAEFPRWFRAFKPDAVITLVREVLPWVRRYAPEVTVGLLNAEQPGDRGVMLRVGDMAAAAFEVLLGAMRQSLFSSASRPLHIEIVGVWTDKVKRKRSPRLG